MRVESVGGCELQGDPQNPFLLLNHQPQIGAPSSLGCVGTRRGIPSNGQHVNPADALVIWTTLESHWGAGRLTCGPSRVVHWCGPCVKTFAPWTLNPKTHTLKQKGIGSWYSKQ